MTIFVFGDTHYHVLGRTSYDRTVNLPTARLASLVRRQDWHREVRPNLFNAALTSWGNTVESFLQTMAAQSTRNVIVIHAGDVGDDALNRVEMTTAFMVTHNVVKHIQSQFHLAWGSNVSFIQALGDHDADCRSWAKEQRTRQIQWLYHLLGLEEHPASYLQELQGQRTKGLLVLDTNLLEEEWINKVKETSRMALQAIQKRTGVSFGNTEDLLQFTVNVGYDPELLALCRDALFESVIIKHRQKQEAIIQKARSLDDVTIVGHKPNVALRVAETFAGDAMVIAGHWHIRYNSDEAHFLRFPTKHTQGGKPIKLLIVAPPTRGLVGIEYASKAVAYIVSIDSDRSAVRAITSPPS